MFKRLLSNTFSEKVTSSEDSDSEAWVDTEDKMPSSGNSETETNMNAVTVKLPEFWTTMPNIWFSRIESQFNLKGITQEQTRFDHLMTQVTEQMAVKVIDVIENPGEAPYTKLKNALIKAYELDEEQKIRELLRDSDLGDRKPSEFFRHMKNLVGKSEAYNDKFLLALWEERLPGPVAAILKVNTYTKTEDLLGAADKIYGSLKSSLGSVCSVNSAFSSQHSETLRELQSRNDKLEHEINALKSRFKNFQPRNRSNSQSRNSNTTSNDSEPKICFYHKKFKERANKCRPPCDFLTKN